MTAQKTIALARSHGINGAYARILSAAIRAATSARMAATYRAAIQEDRASHLFRGLDTSCPTAV